MESLNKSRSFALVMPPRRLPNKRKVASAESGFFIALLRLLFYFLVFSFFLPELRISLSGFYYADPSVGGSTESVGIPWAFEIIIIAIILFFLIALLLEEITIKNDWTLKWTLLMALISALVIPLSDVYGFIEGPGAFGHKRFMFESLVLFLVAYNLPWRLLDLMIITWVFIATTIFHAIIVFFSVQDINILSLNANVIGGFEIPRYAGLFSQPSRYVLFMGMGSILLFYYNIITSNYKITLINMLLFIFNIFCFIGLFLGQSRSGNIALSIVVFMIIYFNRKNIKLSHNKMVFFFLIGIIGIYFMFKDIIDNLLFNRFSFEMIAFEKEESRGYIWPKIIEAILSFPLGTGYDTLYSVLKEGLAHSHNAYLHWTFMFGIPGLILLMFLIYKILNNIYNTEINQINIYLNAMRYALLYYLLSSVTEPFFITHLTICFWLFAAILLHFNTNKIFKKGY